MDLYAIGDSSSVSSVTDVVYIPDIELRNSSILRFLFADFLDISLPALLDDKAGSSPVHAVDDHRAAAFIEEAGDHPVLHILAVLRLPDYDGNAVMALAGYPVDDIIDEGIIAPEYGNSDKRLLIG